MSTRSAKIGDLAQNERGAFKIGPFGSSLKKSELVGSGIPVVGIENVFPNRFEKRFRRFVSPEKFKELSEYEIVSDDVLVTTMGTIGRAAVVPAKLGRAIFDSHLFRMRVDQQRVLPAYLCYAINSRVVEVQLEELARGAIMQGLNTTILRECDIPLPGLSEQGRVSALLEQVDRLRRTRRYALELSDTFLAAAFRELFGDPSKNQNNYPLVAADELFDIQLGKMLDVKRYTGEFLRPYLGNANVQWGRFVLDDLKEMDFPADDFAKFKLEPGDILVCEGGEVGRTAIWRGEVADCCYQKALHRLRIVRDDISAEYFLYYMYAAVTSGLVARYSSSATIGHFTKETLENFPIMLPPVKLQTQFASLVTRHRKLQGRQGESLRQADHLFQSLLHRVFWSEAKIVGSARKANAR